MFSKLFYNFIQSYILFSSFSSSPFFIMSTSSHEKDLLYIKYCILIQGHVSYYPALKKWSVDETLITPSFKSGLFNQLKSYLAIQDEKEFHSFLESHLPSHVTINTFLTTTPSIYEASVVNICFPYTKTSRFTKLNVAKITDIIDALRNSMMHQDWKKVTYQQVLDAAKILRKTSSIWLPAIGMYFQYLLTPLSGNQPDLFDMNDTVFVEKFLYAMIIFEDYPDPYVCIKQMYFPTYPLQGLRTFFEDFLNVEYLKRNRQVGLFMNPVDTSFSSTHSTSSTTSSSSSSSFSTEDNLLFFAVQRYHKNNVIEFEFIQSQFFSMKTVGEVKQHFERIYHSYNLRVRRGELFFSEIPISPDISIPISTKKLPSLITPKLEPKPTSSSISNHITKVNENLKQLLFYFMMIFEDEFDERYIGTLIHNVYKQTLTHQYFYQCKVEYEKLKKEGVLFKFPSDYTPPTQEQLKEAKSGYWYFNRSEQQALLYAFHEFEFPVGVFNYAQVHDTYFPDVSRAQLRNYFMRFLKDHYNKMKREHIPFIWPSTIPKPSTQTEKDPNEWLTTDKEIFFHAIYTLGHTDKDMERIQKDFFPDVSIEFLKEKWNRLRIQYTRTFNKGYTFPLPKQKN